MAKFILDRSALKQQYEKLTNTGFTIAYSVKTNPEVVPFLEEDTNCLFSIVAGEAADEIKDKSKLWYIATAWSEDQIKDLIQKGVTKFVVHNEFDLEVLEKTLETIDVKVELHLRMKIKENTIYTGKHYMFGMSSKKINAHISRLKDNSNISSLGVHFYRKTQNVSEWNFIAEIEESLSKETLEIIDVLNVGGGLPIQYVNSNMNVLPGIFERLKELVSWCKKHNLTPMMEPGRFIVGPAVKLEANIIAKYGDTLIVDCSIFNAALDTYLIGHRLLIEDEGEGEEYLIKGCTPDSTDILRYKVKLPVKNVGDKLIFLNAGAYTFNADFCGLKKLELEVQPK